MRLACEYVSTLWPKPGMEVETDFRIARYRPLPGEKYTAEFIAKGEGLPEHNFFEIALEGKMVSDPQYGDTFLVNSFETTVKKTRANILGYLASGAVKGVGPAVAKRIVDHFGVETLDILEKDPSRLREVSGIGEKVLQEMVGSFEEHREINALMLYVGQYYGEALSRQLPAKSPITTNKAKRIVEHFGSQALEVVKSDIYHLCEVDGFGFITVDAMAERMRQPMNTLPRVKAAALYTLKQNRQKGGHLYMEPEEFLRELKRNLNHQRAGFRFRDDALRPLANEVLCAEEIVYRNRLIYLKKDFLNEQTFASKMAARLFQDQQASKAIPTLVDTGKTLSLEQEQAAMTALTHNTCVITGGPGTGKTTVVKTILDTFLKTYPKKDGILLCAPTGRAAKRLSEATGYPASTVHKAFGLWSEGHTETDGAEQKLDLVILDEASMLDMWLATQVITRISPETKLVLVGDAAQLPSVGPGNVLREVIQSGEVPVVQLKTVFRQAGGSSIAINAQLIEQAETDLIFDDNFVFLPAQNQEEAMYLICALYQRAVQAVSRDKVQILTPVRKNGHACGVNNLNTVIQGMTQDEPGTGCHRYGRFFCTGDPVIQIRNADGIYNGEVGVIQEAEMNRIQVRFTGSDKDLPYEDGKLDLLDLAYALTVHKSQGSEYPIVIIPVLKEHKFMLNRNLLYTAVTRGKARVFLVGNRWALNYAIFTEDTSKRHTALAFRIRESCRKLREAAENVRQMPAA